MANKNFILLSLEDAKIKKVSNVISNDSCRKILDYLSDKEATETEIAQNLQIPISTVHYNLQQLMETGLIEIKEFHYSEKGKEVNHYKLANKYIIIAPKKTFGIKERLKAILPVALMIGASALVLQYFQKFFVQGGITKILTDTKQTLVRETFVTHKISEKVVESVPTLASAAKETATPTATAAYSTITPTIQQEAAKAIPKVVQNITNKTTEYMLTPQVTSQTITTHPSIWSNIALWFLIGALFALGVYFIIRYFRRELE